MVITNKIESRFMDQISAQIYRLIQSEPQLTKRSLSDIRKILLNNGFYVALDNLEVLGFIAKEKLTGNYYELKCWYVVHKKRNTGLSTKIFRKALEVHSHSYLGVTFQQNIVEKLKPLQFQVIRITELPIKVIIKYISTRQFKSIIKHTFKRKSYLLIKK